MLQRREFIAGIGGTAAWAFRARAQQPIYAAEIYSMIRRREFIAGLWGVVAWPVAAQAQRPAPPLIGFLGMYRLVRSLRAWTGSERA